MADANTQERGEVNSPPCQNLPAEERARAEIYLLLGRLLGSAPDEKLLASLSQLEGDGTLGPSLYQLSLSARDGTVETCAAAYHQLFIGVGEGELIPFGSYYMTGFLNERPLARLRQDMARFGIARQDDTKEPEDWIASLCEMMAGLILGAFGNTVTLEEQNRFYTAHLAPWAPQFFGDLASTQTSAFYRSVGDLGQAFMTLEGQSFDMAA